MQNKGICWFKKGLVVALAINIYELLLESKQLDRGDLFE